MAKVVTRQKKIIYNRTVLVLVLLFQYYKSYKKKYESILNIDEMTSDVTAEPFPVCKCRLRCLIWAA